VSVWYWIVGIGIIALVAGGMSLYFGHLEDKGYWVPNSTRDLTVAVVIVLVLILIALPQFLEVVG
jgi:hypothetical protein